MATKRDFINAYTWMFGATKKKAETEYKNNINSNPEYINMIVDSFKENAKKNFYES